jgi:hypothetical protein
VFPLPVISVSVATSCCNLAELIRNDAFLGTCDMLLFKISFVGEMDKFAPEHQVFLCEYCVECNSAGNSEKKVFCVSGSSHKHGS